MPAKASISSSTPKQRRPASLHRGRMLALQVLYETDMTDHDWRASLGHHAETLRSSLTSKVFAERLVTGVLTERLSLDAEVARFAPTYPVNQLALVDRNILRIAIYEIRREPDTPLRVVIDEAVELAKTYGGETSSPFVNGVLGAVAEAHLRTSDAQASRT